MAGVLIPTLSILAIAVVVWLATLALRVRLCPICLGVGGTWLWLLGARFLDLGVDTSMLPILLGGSVAGTAYLLEKHLPAGRSGLAWKTLFIPTGFIAAYGLAAPHWGAFAGAAGALVVLAGVFFRPQHSRGEDSAVVANLKQRMKDCC